MEKYLGVKLIQAEPQTVQDGVTPISVIEGYKVIYPDGYISWSPKAVFEEAYRRVDNLTFGLAIEALKKGHKVARQGWNGKGMWLKLIPAGNAMYCGYDMQDCIGMKTANNVMQPGWLASQTDILAEDWVIVE